MTVLFSTCVPLLIFKSVRVFSQLHLRSRPARPAAGAPPCAPRGARAAREACVGVRTPPRARESQKTRERRCENKKFASVSVPIPFG